MYLTVMTHASARDSEYSFRGLTAAGQAECAAVAEQYGALVAGERAPAFDRIVSSPKPRCLETVILFAKELGNERMAASSVAVDGGLAAGRIEGGELEELASAQDAAQSAEHVLVSGHADMVKALPGGVSLAEGAADGGWFAVRPVLFQVEVKAGRPWDEATVRFCGALVDGRWRDLLG